VPSTLAMAAWRLKNPKLSEKKDPSPRIRNTGPNTFCTGADRADSYTVRYLIVCFDTIQNLKH
jgi:hypothetical protein